MAEVTRSSRTRAGDVADVLRDRILAGSLATGMKLPSENELAATYEVSRSVVREALQQLQASGLVESYQGRGTYVLTLPDANGSDASAFRAVTRDDAAALLEYRTGLESEGAAWAASRATELQLKGIERALERFMESGTRPQDVIPADYDLHLRIATASGNRYCREALVQLGPRMIMIQRAAMAAGVDVTNPTNFDRVCREHEAIVVAIRARDPLNAAAAMRLHLTGSKYRLEHH